MPIPKLFEPVLAMQDIQFGDARKIGNDVIDKWLEKWQNQIRRKSENFNRESSTASNSKYKNFRWTKEQRRRKSKYPDIIRLN